MVAEVNKTAFSMGAETALGVPPTGSSDWTRFQPNAVGSFGASQEDVTRRYIDSEREAFKGTVTDITAGAEFDLDMISDHVRRMLPGFVHAQWQGNEESFPTAVSATQYTHPARAAAIPTGRLVVAKGFGESANNQVGEVTASTTTTTNVSGLVAEASPPAGAILQVCGVRGATGDFEINAAGNLITTTLDCTTLGIPLYSYIFVGGVAAANRFADTANVGLARVMSITANEIVLAKRTGTFNVDSGAGRQIDIHFGRLCKPVAVGDALFLTESNHIRAHFQEVPDDRYQYVIGARPNEMSINLQARSKAEMSIGYLAQNESDMLAAPLTGDDTPVPIIQGEAYNTSSDVARLRIQELDETGLASCIENLSFTLNNNIGREPALGVTGAKFLPIGDFDVGFTADFLLDDYNIINAIKARTSLCLETALRNGDAGLIYEYPSFYLGDKTYAMERGAVVRVSGPGRAFKHPTMGHSFSITELPFQPLATAS